MEAASMAFLERAMRWARNGKQQVTSPEWPELLGQQRLHPTYLPPTVAQAPWGWVGT